MRKFQVFLTLIIAVSTWYQSDCWALSDAWLTGGGAQQCNNYYSISAKNSDSSNFFSSVSDSWNRSDDESSSTAAPNCAASALSNLLPNSDSTAIGTLLDSYTNNGQTSMLGIQETASQLGLDLTGKKMSYDELQKQTSPVIAHLNLANGQGHYVDIIKTTSSAVSYLDGNTIKTVSRADFEGTWDGTILTQNSDIGKNLTNSELKDISGGATVKVLGRFKDESGRLVTLQQTEKNYYEVIDSHSQIISNGPMESLKNNAYIKTLIPVGSDSGTASAEPASLSGNEIKYAHAIELMEDLVGKDAVAKIKERDQAAFDSSLPLVSNYWTDITSAFKILKDEFGEETAATLFSNNPGLFATQSVIVKNDFTKPWIELCNNVAGKEFTKLLFSNDLYTGYAALRKINDTPEVDFKDGYNFLIQTFG